jgi:hypothetical protein
LGILAKVPAETFGKGTDRIDLDMAGISGNASHVYSSEGVQFRDTSRNLQFCVSENLMIYDLAISNW